MTPQDLVVLGRVLGVPLRLGEAVEADPPVGVLDTQDVAERVGSEPRAFPQVGQLCRTGADLALLERAVVSARSAPVALRGPPQLGPPEPDSAAQ